MPKGTSLPTDPRFPSFRAWVESEDGAQPDSVFYADERPERAHEPYHTEPARAFRKFIAGWDAALAVQAQASGLAAGSHPGSSPQPREDQ